MTMLYPSNYVPPAEVVFEDITEAQKTWAKNRLQAYMDENRGYLLEELVAHIQDELISLDPPKCFPTDVISAVVLELDAEWGYHPPVEEP